MCYLYMHLDSSRRQWPVRRCPPNGLTRIEKIFSNIVLQTDVRRWSRPPQQLPWHCYCVCRRPCASWSNAPSPSWVRVIAARPPTTDSNCTPSTVRAPRCRWTRVWTSWWTFPMKPRFLWWWYTNNTCLLYKYLILFNDTRVVYFCHTCFIFYRLVVIDIHGQLYVGAAVEHIWCQ